MQKNKIRVLMLIISLSCFDTAFGATFDVSTSAQIQNAFNDAAHNGEDDIINIAAGHYDLGETLHYIQGEQYSITIQGAGMGQTVIDGGGEIQVMDVDTTQTSKDYGTTVVVKGITFQNGYTVIDGGGLSIKTRQAHAIVESSSFLSNKAFPPEPINWLDWGDGGGGGLFVATGVNNKNADVTIQDCLFKDNQSINGAGAYIWSVDELLPKVKIINSIFNNNMSDVDGGGLWIRASRLCIINNTLFGNESDGNGGGIYFSQGKSDVFNNIVWGNKSFGLGDDIYFYDLWSKPINLFNNTYGVIAFFEGDTYSEGESSNENPLLDESYNLDEQSKCINSGDNYAPDLPTTDYKGNHRISGSTVDRGAIEYGSSPAPDPDPEPDPGPDNSSGTGGGSGCFIVTMISTMDYGVKIDPNSEAYKAAKRIAEMHRSEKVQSEIDRQEKRLKPLVSKQRAEIYQNACSKTKQELKTGENELLIFISSSMPPGLTRNFVNGANKIECNVKFILSGQPQQGINQFVNDIKGRQQRLDLYVDPLLFDAYEITSVPAVIFNREVLVKHPQDIKNALLLVQKTIGEDLKDLIKPITY